MPRTREDQNIVAKVKETAREKLAEVEDQASELYQQGVKKTRAALKGGEDLIRRHPVSSVLVAAGVGLLFGRFRVRPLESLLIATGAGLVCGVLLSSAKARPRG